MNPPLSLRIQARANRLAPRRLHGAMAALRAADLHAPRAGFVPSLAQTLDHVLAVDLYDVAALQGEAGTATTFRDVVASDTLARLAPRQAARDTPLIGCCDALDARRCDAWVQMPRRDHVQRDRAGHVLAHPFMHQADHRGQAHAMLSGTALAPTAARRIPDAERRAAARRRHGPLGWDEAAVYGGTEH
jgi:uncharacterized damage-inducible protein DinB